MANKKKRYASFGDWLLWLRNLAKTTVKSRTCALRGIENEGLLQQAGVSRSFGDLHEMLNEIDTGRRDQCDLDEIIEDLRKIYDKLKEVDDEKLDRLETYNGYMEAFKLYLRFLVDVTDCFSEEYTKKICDIRFPKRSNSDDIVYKKMLRIFRSGTFQIFADRLINKKWDKQMEDFYKALDIVLNQKGSMQVLARCMQLSGNFHNRISWREIALEKMENALDTDLWFQGEYDLNYNWQCAFGNGFCHSRKPYYPQNLTITPRCSDMEIIEHRVRVLSHGMLLTELASAIASDAKNSPEQNSGRYTELYVKQFAINVSTLIQKINEYFDCFNLEFS